MPPKKTVTAQKMTGDSGPVLSEGSDPVQAAVNIIDKKVRNLEKRKVSTACSLFLPFKMVCKCSCSRDSPRTKYKQGA